MSTNDAVEVVITAPDADWLTAFTRQLVEDRLAAGAHLITPIRSIYRWHDEIHDITEARIAIHTVASLVPAIVARANEQHPYEVPCVIAWPITHANPEYIDWIRVETSP